MTSKSIYFFGTFSIFDDILSIPSMPSIVKSNKSNVINNSIDIFTNLSPNFVSDVSPFGDDIVDKYSILDLNNNNFIDNKDMKNKDLNEELNKELNKELKTNHIENLLRKNINSRNNSITNSNHNSIKKSNSVKHLPNYSISAVSDTNPLTTATIIRNDEFIVKEVANNNDEKLLSDPILIKHDDTVTSVKHSLVCFAFLLI